MSRYYEMSVNITEYNPEKAEDIKDAADADWPFGDDWSCYNNTLFSVGRSSLSGGEGEDEFATRLTHAIWRANGGFCKVAVNATYLEDLPYESYELDQEDYNKVKDILKIGEDNG